MCMKNSCSASRSTGEHERDDDEHHRAEEARQAPGARAHRAPAAHVEERHARRRARSPRVRTSTTASGEAASDRMRAIVAVRVSAATPSQARWTDHARRSSSPSSSRRAASPAARTGGAPGRFSAAPAGARCRGCRPARCAALRAAAAARGRCPARARAVRRRLGGRRLRGRRARRHARAEVRRRAPAGRRHGRADRGRHAPPALLAPGAAIVPVPAHPGRRRARGFDPADLLARALARRTGLPLAARPAPPRRRGRARLGASRHVAARARAACGSRRAAQAPPLVVLVDDVHTTGATLERLRGRAARRRRGPRRRRHVGAGALASASSPTGGSGRVPC